MVVIEFFVRVNCFEIRTVEYLSGFELNDERSVLKQVSAFFTPYTSYLHSETFSFAEDTGFSRFDSLPNAF